MEYCGKCLWYEHGFCNCLDEPTDYFGECDEFIVFCDDVKDYLDFVRGF